MAENTELQQQRENQYLENPKVFHLEMPLYFPLDLKIGSTKEKVHALMAFSGTIDAYCIWCEKDSVFDASPSHRWVFHQWQEQIEDSLQTFSWDCAHNRKHEYHSYYFLRSGENAFQKIGQFPSAADFQIPQASKYRKVLGEEQYKELTRGIGLAAHGVGIGSFVYLRRIFEDLIEEAYQIAFQEGRINEDQYKEARMDGKIVLLKDDLPSFLVENSSLYSILSKGIHELTEEECLQYFEAVRIGIEQILDEKIEQKEKVSKAAQARKVIQDLSRKMSGKPEEDQSVTE